MFSEYPTIGYFRCNKCGKKFIKKTHKVHGDIVLSPVTGELIIPPCPKCKSTNVKKIISFP